MLFSVIQMITWPSLFLRCVGGVSSYFFAHTPIKMPPPSKFSNISGAQRRPGPTPNWERRRNAQLPHKKGAPLNTTAPYGTTMAPKFGYPAMESAICWRVPSKFPNIILRPSPPYSDLFNRTAAPRSSVKQGTDTGLRNDPGRADAGGGAVAGNNYKSRGVPTGVKKSRPAGIGPAIYGLLDRRSSR